MKNKEKPDILNRIKSIKARRELTALLAFFVMISTSYAMIHPGEALNSNIARSFMFFNEEEGTDASAEPDINALLDIDKNSGEAEQAEEAPIQEEVTEEVQNEETASAQPQEQSSSEPTSTPAETVIPTLEPANTPANTAVAAAEVTGNPTGTPESSASAEPSASPSALPEETEEPTKEDWHFANWTEEDGEDNKPEIVVVVDAPYSAFPEGTTMKVEIIEVDEEIEKHVEEAVDDKNTTVKYIQAVDISFWNEGKEIEPAEEIKVSMKSSTIEETKKDTDTETKLVHIAEDKENNNKKEASLVKDEKVDLDQDATDDEIILKSDEFSVYVIVGTETITVDYLTSDGETYTITVNFDKREELSNNMELIVSEIDKDSETYAQCLADAKAAMGMPEEDNVSYARFFDITIKKDGETFEPIYPATVTIDYDEAIELGEDETLTVVHFAETGAEVIGNEEITISDDNKEIVYEQNSFSITGTIIHESSNIANNWAENGNYLLVISNGTNSYLIDKDGNLTPVVLESSGKVIIDTIGGVDITTKEQLADYVWALHKGTNVSRYRANADGTGSWRTQNINKSAQLKNGNNYIIPANSTGLSTNWYGDTGRAIASDTGDRLIINRGYTASTDRNSSPYSLSITTGNVMFDKITRGTDYNRYYYSRYLGVNSDGTKLTGANTSSNGWKEYLVRSIHVDGEDYTLDDLPTFEEPTDVDWDFERSVYDTDIINTLKAPVTKKILTDNSDGTYDLTLSITGQSAAASDINKVDVVVVIDRSTSMNIGNRLRSAVDAAKAIGTTDSLFQNSGVRISVIDFDTTVSNISQWYTSDQSSQYQSYVESLSGTIPLNHYTNWQQALKAAGNQLMEGRNDAYKYVIFLTDGNPTVYGESGDQYGGTEGPGRDNDANWGTCTNAALPYAQKLIKEGAALYVVGCGEATNAYTFTARAYYGDSYDQMSGAPAGRYLDASDDTIGSAFASVAEEIIASFTYADVAFNDGITTDYTATTLVEGNVSAASIKVIDKNGNDVTSTEGQYVSVDYTGGNAKLSFKYVKASDGTTLAVGAVTEGIGDNAGKFFDSNGDQVVPYTLKDGYKYSATFKVWPKQEAMDRIAELNNGATYTSEDEAKGIVNNGDGTYTLNTNTSAVLTYKTVTTVEGEDPVYSEEKRVDNIPCTDENGDPASIELLTTGMVLQKLWNVGLQTSQFTNMYSWTYGGDTGRSEPMLHLQYTDSSSVTHHEQFRVMPIAANAPSGSTIGADWPVQTSTGVYQTLYTGYSIAPGIMVTTLPSGVTPKDTWTIGGTSYYVLETGHDYVITEDYISGNMEPLNETYHPMIFGDKLYNVVESNGTRTMTEMSPDVLTANNYLRGGINVSKKVVDAENTEITTDTSTFQVKIDVTIPSGTASSFSSWDNKYVIWYDTYASQEDAAAGNIMYEVNGKPAAGVDSSDVTQNFNYIDVTSGSGTKTLDIKAGWVIRLVNVLDGTTYTVTETENNGYEVTYSLNGGTASATPASGSVNKNAENNVQVINKQTTVPVVFKKLKTGTTDEYLDGAVFKITKWNGSSFVNVENVEGVDASSMFTIASGQNGISLPLTPGDYMMEEQTPPPGYIKTVSGVYFTVGSTISMTTEMKEIEGVETEVAKTEAAYAEPDSGDSDQRTLLIYNTPGVELPSTGGPGTLLYTLSGLALMLVAALMYGFRMRRRERRLN